ncbi:MAG: MFS transporter [Halodesulfurarchaeum sp.]
MGLRGLLSRPLAPLTGNGREWVLISIATGWGLLVGTRMSYPILLPFVREEFGLSLSVAGLLVTIVWLGSALGQLPGGILSDRYSERRLLSVALLVVAGAIGVVVAAGPLGLFLGTALVGLGLSLYPIARISVLTELYPQAVGSALGVTMATGDIGQTLLPPAVGFLAGAAAWQLGFGALAPLFLLLAGVVWLVVPKSAVTTADRSEGIRERTRDLFAVLATRTMTLTTLVLFVYLLVWQSFTGFYPTYLHEVKGLSPGVASAVFALFFGVGVLVKPAAGAAYDRLGMRSSLVAVLVGPVLGLSALPFVDGVLAIGGLTAIVSMMLGSGAITQSYLAEAIPRELRGTGLGVVRTTAATLGSAGPVLFGAIAEHGFFDEGYLLLSGLMGVVLGLTLLMPDG